MAQQRKRITTTALLLLLVQGLAGCGGSGSPAGPATPGAPPAALPVAQPTPVQQVVFSDPPSGFSTSEVRDVHGQIVRFTTAPALIWADGTHFSGYRVHGNSITAETICHACVVLVRFATQDGERRAYLTWPDVELHGRADHPPPTILDIEVVGGKVVIADTNVLLW